MGFIKDFREFASKGNVVDLAIGVIIGGAFGKIVTAMVDDIIMPLIGLASGGKKFDDNYIILKAPTQLPVNDSLEAMKASGANVFAYGHFIQTVVDFIIIALCIFIAIRTATKLRRKKEAAVVAAPPVPTKTEALLTEIRDALKQRP